MHRREEATDDDKFLYDGKFVANPAVSGSWTTLEVVTNIADFQPGKKPNPGRAPIRAMTFNSDGTSGEARWIWSGDMLMDLENNVALKINPQTIAGIDYLFIEAGGFSPKNPAGWQTQWFVMKRN